MELWLLFLWLWLWAVQLLWRGPTELWLLPLLWQSSGQRPGAVGRCSGCTR